MVRPRCCACTVDLFSFVAGDVVSARFSPCPGSDKLVVIKIECNSIVGTKRIPNEQAAYEALKGIPGIPRCYEVVCFKNHGIIVLDRLGDNLRKYKESCGLSLPIITIYTLGKAIVSVCVVAALRTTEWSRSKFCKISMAEASSTEISNLTTSCSRLTGSCNLIWWILASQSNTAIRLGHTSRNHKSSLRARCRL